MRNLSDNPIRIVLVEDDKTVREGLQMLLNGSPGFRCAAAYPNGEEALRNIEGINPDVVLMDIHLPGISGIECVVKIKERHPTLQIIMLTVFEDNEAIFDSLAAAFPLTLGIFNRKDAKTQRKQC
ncbi:MAG: response regulator transcription factor [Calditrichia bacterium]|nr:response regulator transcription factor [Calditrichia bacterium]